MNSSEIQVSQAPNSSTSIQSIEISIQNLIKSWNRRQKWQLFVNSRKDDHHDQRATWRTLLINFLESTSLRIITILLLLVDLILTSLELSSSLLSCSKKKNNTIEETWFHYIGIAILSLLSLKILALMVGLGISFFRRFGYVLDGIVVVVALFLEAYLEKKGGGLVVVVSLWRIVRVVESAFELSDETIQTQIEEIICQFETLKDENNRLQEIIVEKDMIIEKLQEELEIYKA